MRFETIYRVNLTRSSDSALRHFCSRAHTLTLSFNLQTMYFFYTCMDLAITSLFRPFKNIDDDDDEVMQITNVEKCLVVTCLKMSDLLVMSVSHVDIQVVQGTVVNTRKHYFCVRVIEPINNLNCATVDFSSLRRFRCFLRRTDLSQYLKHSV